jgi:hypothetical protein
VCVAQQRSITGQSWRLHSELVEPGWYKREKEEKKAGSVFGAASRSSLAAYPGLALAKLVKYANASLSRAHLVDTWASLPVTFLICSFPFCRDRDKRKEIVGSSLPPSFVFMALLCFPGEDGVEGPMLGDVVVHGSSRWKSPYGLLWAIDLSFSVHDFKTVSMFLCILSRSRCRGRQSCIPGTIADDNVYQGIKNSSCLGAMSCRKACVPTLRSCHTVDMRFIRKTLTFSSFFPFSSSLLLQCRLFPFPGIEKIWGGSSKTLACSAQR